MLTGLDVLLQNPKKYMQGARIGLCANQTTVDAKYRHAVDVLHAHKDANLTLLFGPEHGLRGDAQYMETVGDAHDSVTGLPEVSLYGKTFESLTPKSQHLDAIDIFMFDIQDVGTRYYTYAATLALAMRAAKEHNKRVLVLDRPNPIGGTQVEGGGLEPGLENFCGLYPVPQRHGMTVGELARLYNTTFGIGCDLDVVTCEGYLRHSYFDELDAPWVLPSPNMPTIETALVYPGMCLLEGTNISEGRGTTRPFEILGAAYADGRALASKLSELALPGVVFRPCVFTPTFDKFTRQTCFGVQLHITDRQTFLSYRTGLAVIWAFKQLWPTQFAWRQEPYEFRDDVPAIDLLTGFTDVREGIDRGDSFDAVMKRALRGTQIYDTGRDAALLYT